VRERKEKERKGKERKEKGKKWLIQAGIGARQEPDRRAPTGQISDNLPSK
jgi:hypothetical protein